MRIWLAAARNFLTNLHADSEVCSQILRKWNFGFIHQILTYTRDKDSDADSLTTFSSRVNPLLFMTLNELITYGPDYLTPEESLHG